VDIYNNPLQQNKSNPDYTKVIQAEYDSRLRLFFTKLDEEFAVCGGCPPTVSGGIGSFGMSFWRISSPASGGYHVDKLRDVDTNFKPLSRDSTISFFNQEDYQVCLFHAKDSGIKCYRLIIDLKTFRVVETDLDVGGDVGFGVGRGHVLLSPKKLVSFVVSSRRSMFGRSVVGGYSIQTFTII
jgi:hypothetical protein